MMNASNSSFKRMQSRKFYLAIQEWKSDPWKRGKKTGHATMAILLAGGEQIKTLRNAQKG